MFWKSCSTKLRCSGLCLLEAYVYVFFQHWKKSLGDSDNSSFFFFNAWLHHFLMSFFFHTRKFCCLQQYMRGFVADCHKFFYFIIILAWVKLIVLYFKLQDKQPCNGRYLNKKKMIDYTTVVILWRELELYLEKDERFWQLPVTTYSYNVTNFHFMEKCSLKNASLINF